MDELACFAPGMLALGSFGYGPVLLRNFSHWQKSILSPDSRRFPAIFETLPSQPLPPQPLSSPYPPPSTRPSHTDTLRSHLAQPAAACLSLYPLILNVHTNIVSPLFSSFRTLIFPLFSKIWRARQRRRKRKWEMQQLNFACSEWEVLEKKKVPVHGWIVIFVIVSLLIIEGATLKVVVQGVKKGAVVKGMKMKDYVWRSFDPTSVGVMAEVVYCIE